MRKGDGMSKQTQRRGNHSGRLELRGNKWLAIWMVNGKRQSQSTGETDRAAAEKWLARKLETVKTSDGLRKLDKDAETIREMQKTVLGAALVEIEKQKAELSDGVQALRFDEAWNAYERTPKRKSVTPITLSHIQVKFERLWKWIAENHPEVTELRHVTPEIAAEFAGSIRGEYVPATYNLFLAAYSQIWTTLAAEIRATTNPWGREHLPRLDAPESERRDITDEELARIFEAARKVIPPLHYLFMVLLYTGMRIGDAAKLEWRHIDLARGFISIMPEKTRRFKTRVKIPILPPLRAMLESYPPNAREGYVMPEMAKQYKRGKLSEMVTRFFKNKCGIETNRKTDVGKRRHSVVTAHSFRHTFISKAANAGIPFAIVQQIVGHSTAKQCRHYFHEDEDATLRAFAAFPIEGHKRAALANHGQGDVIEADFVETPAPTEREARRAALVAALAEIEKNGDADERKAAAELLADRAREFSKP